jgi:DNA-binding MarR family transcriptional regulator
MWESAPTRKTWEPRSPPGLGVKSRRKSLTAETRRKYIYVVYDASHTIRWKRRLIMTKQPILDLAAEIDRDLRAIRQILRQPVEAEIARGGLTGPQQSAMHVLLTSGGLSLKDLSKELGLAHSTVSGIVDRLEKQGLVERQADQADRRVSKIAVSEVVRGFVGETMPSLEMHPLAEALRAAMPSERRTVREGVRILHGLLRRPNKKQPVGKTR